MVEISGWSASTPALSDNRAEAIGVALVSDGDTAAGSIRTFLVKDIWETRSVLNLVVTTTGTTTAQQQQPRAERALSSGDYKNKKGSLSFD